MSWLQHVGWWGGFRKRLTRAALTPRWLSWGQLLVALTLGLSETCDKAFHLRKPWPLSL